MVWVALSLAVSALAGPKPFPVQYEQTVAGREVTICLDGSKVERTFAGKLAFRDENHEWQSYCADVRSPIGPGMIYSVQNISSTLYGGNVALAGNIIAKYFYEAQTDDQCAGLQLAVWKALEDGTEQADFLSGHFQAKASPAVLAYATLYYKAIGTSGNAIFLQTGGAGGGQGGAGGGQGGGAGGGGAQGSGGGGGGQNQMSE